MPQAYKHLFARPEKVLISSGWRELQKTHGRELRTDLGILIMANIRGFLCAASGAAIASLAMSTAVLADDEAPKFGYSLTMSATSDYIFRGISSNDQDPAFQPYLEFTYGIGYLGFWGSNVAAPANPFELDIVAGLRPVTGPVTWDIGVLWYTYPRLQIASDLDYVEFKVGGSITPMTNVSLGLTGYVTPTRQTMPSQKRSKAPSLIRCPTSLLEPRSLRRRSAAWSAIPTPIEMTSFSVKRTTTPTGTPA